MDIQNEALAICSEFADEYGVDGESIVVYTKSEYINQLKICLKIKTIN